MSQPKKGDFIPDSHFDVMLVEPINDPRLTPTMELCRSGKIQMFREKSYQGRDFMTNNPDSCDAIIEPPQKHYFATLVGSEWWWANGCAECCGHKRNWMTYIECDNHNVCAHCGCSRESLTEAPWGRQSGWVCKPCGDKEHEEEKQAALAAMPEEYDKWDYYSNDKITCPYCNYKFNDSDGHYESDEENEECPRCDNTFTVTANHSVTFTTKRVGEA